MPAQKNISLQSYNSFHIDVKAAEFVSIATVNELEELLRQKKALLILGGGSNILFSKDVDGLVLKIDIRGIDEVKEDNTHIYVRAGAGENWHEFVNFTMKRNWGGLENLSLIPGNVGASPMQNIGAYGVELKEVFYELEAFSIKEQKVYTFSVNDCGFGYRDSVFKKKHKGEFIILDVVFRFYKKPKKFHCLTGDQCTFRSKR